MWCWRSATVLTRQNGKYDGSAWFLAEGGEAPRPSFAGRARTGAKGILLQPARVEGTFTNEEARAIGLPAVCTTDQAPDLYLTASPGYAFWTGQDGALTQDVNPVAGSHGYSNTDPDMQELVAAEKVHVWQNVPTFQAGSQCFMD